MNKKDDYIDKIKIHNSLFVKGCDRSEVIVYLDTPAGLASIASSQDKHGRARTYYNYVNELSEINSSAEKAVQDVSFDKKDRVEDAEKIIYQYIAKQPYAVDEKTLNTELKKYSDNYMKAQEAFKGYCFWSNSIKSIAQLYGKPLEYDVKAMSVYHSYVSDLVEAKLAQKDMNEVKKPDERLSFWDKFLGRSYTWAVDGVRDEICMLTPAQTEELKKCLESGFPGVSSCKGRAQKYMEQEHAIYGKYPFESANQMRTDVLHALTMRAVEDALRYQYFSQTKDMSILMDDKEKKAFEKMSFEQMVEQYGFELLTTHKGCVMVGIKIAQVKENKNLGKTLDCLAQLLDEQKKSYYCPNVPEDVRYHLFEELKKHYQKFGAADKNFRGVFEKLLPTSTEMAELQYLVKSAEGTALHDRLFAKQVQQKKLKAELNKIITGKEDVRKVKERLKQKWNMLKTEKGIEDNDTFTGFSANEELSKQAQKGYTVTKKAVEQENKAAAKKQKAALKKIITKHQK